MSESLPTLRPSPARVFGGVWWLTFKQFLTVNQLLFTLGAMALLFVVGYAATMRDSVHNFYGWIGNFYFLLLAPLLVFVSSGGAMRDQMKPAAADYIFTRPVSRWLYIVFRFLAQVIALSLSYLPILAAAVSIGFIRDVPGLAGYIPRLLSIHLLAIAAVSGFGFLLASLTSRYIVVGLAYGFVIEMGLGAIPTQISRLSMSRHIRNLLQPFIESVSSDGLDSESVSSALALIGFALVTLAISAVVMQRHEFSGDRAKDV